MNATSIPYLGGAMTSLPRWTNTLLVACIGVSLALLTMKLLPQDISTPSARPAAVSQSNNSSAPDTLTLARGIAAHHVFGNAAARPVQAEPVEREAPIEDTRTNLQLAGVFAADPKERAIAIISSGNAEQSAYGIGDKITNEISLKEVFPEYVIISNRGKDEKLALPESVQATAVTPIRTAATTNRTQQANQTEDLSQPLVLPTSPGELRDTLARNPSMLGRVVAAEPYQENGKLVGYRITPKQNPEILEAQGIVAGDINN